MDEFVFDVRGFRISGLRMNEGAKNKILCVHGYKDNAATFIKLAEYLPGFDIVAIDLPGHGKSAHLSRASDYSMFTSVAALDAVCMQLKWTSFNLIGHSLGASVSMLFASARSDFIKTLILLDGIGPLTEPLEKSTDRLMAFLDALHQAQIRTSEPNPHLKLARFFGLSEVSPLLPSIVDRYYERTDDGYVKRYDSKLNYPSPLYMTEERVLHYLGKITCHTLLIRYEPGYPFDETKFASRMSVIQNLKFVKMQGSHHLHVLNPEAVAVPIMDFINHGNG